MVSIGPYTQAYDMRHQWDFSDLRGKTKKKGIEIPENSVMGAINKIEDFSIFRKIVKKARLEYFLADRNLFSTILIPSDMALKDKYPDKFIDDMDIGYARNLVLFSSLQRYMSEEFITFNKSSYYPTRKRGNKMYITNINGVTELPGCTKVLHWNYRVCNGLIHVVDNLLIPSNTMYPL